MTESYDGVLIGPGRGGTPLATALASAGWRTALVEREHVGRTRINEGCTRTNGVPGRIFHKLLLNFTWWVNRKDAEGNKSVPGLVRGRVTAGGQTLCDF